MLATWEKSGDYLSLQDSLTRAFMLRGMVMPSIYWRPTNNQQGTNMMAKTTRIKSAVEPLLQSSRLFFSAGIPNLDVCFSQMVRFDGIHKSGSTRKDNFPDSS